MATHTQVTSILERIAAAGTTYGSDQIGSREALIELGRDLVAALEIPSEFLQRTFWAEVSSDEKGHCPRADSLLYHSQHCLRTANLPCRSSSSNTLKMLGRRALVLEISPRRPVLMPYYCNASCAISSP